MKTLRILGVLALATSVSAAAAPPCCVASPEDVGISSARLKRIDDLMARLQSENKLAGAVTVVARRGKLVSMKAHGFADLEAKRPMRVDNLFQIQSMTKPIATVATLTLLEEGRFLLSDPVDKFLPEFRDMKVAVARAEAPGGYELVPTTRRITILDLLTTGRASSACRRATLRPRRCDARRSRHCRPTKTTHSRTTSRTWPHLHSTRSPAPSFATARRPSCWVGSSKSSPANRLPMRCASGSSRRFA